MMSAASALVLRNFDQQNLETTHSYLFVVDHAISAPNQLDSPTVGPGLISDGTRTGRPYGRRSEKKVAQILFPAGPAGAKTSIKPIYFGLFVPTMFSEVHTFTVLAQGGSTPVPIYFGECT